MMARWRRWAVATVAHVPVANVLAAAVLLAVGGAPAAADTAAIKVGVNRAMDATLMVPEGPGRHPAILVLHTSGGLQTADLDVAKRLVAAGYVALVPAYLDAYGIRPQSRQMTFTTDAEPIYADLVAALDLLRHDGRVDGGKLGAIGFSSGGYFALWLAATGQTQAGVSYYGALTGAGTDKTLARFRQTFTGRSAPVLILHGTDDATVPVEKAVQLDAILAAKDAPHELRQYRGAGHLFDRGGNDAAAADAWQRTLTFLGKTSQNRS